MNQISIFRRLRMAILELEVYYCERRKQTITIMEDTRNISENLGILYLE